MARADINQDENSETDVCSRALARASRNSRISRVSLRGTKRKRKKTPSSVSCRAPGVVRFVVFLFAPRPWHKFNSFRPIGLGTLKETPLSVGQSTIFSRGMYRRVRVYNEPLIAKSPSPFACHLGHSENRRITVSSRFIAEYYYYRTSLAGNVHRLSYSEV